MIPRNIFPLLLQGLAESPAVCLLGPRQVGKTTLALEAGRQLDALYLDLESPQDRRKLEDAETYLGHMITRPVILDEVHRAPGLFPILRGIIDQARRDKAPQGRFLLLGSASLDMLRQSGETLAGRVRFLELGPFHVLENTGSRIDTLWVRGGFPESLLADTDARSLRWRQDFIRTYLERDIPQFGPKIAAETLRRFWTMLAHAQGGLLNTAALARSNGVDPKTALRYVDLLVDLLLVRRLAPWHTNVGKRLVRSPKVYLRDSGVLHALLGIGDLDALLSHPVVGASWEGFVIENLLAASDGAVTPYFYRTAAGAEVDVLLVFPDGDLWVLEIKRSLAPRLDRGFHAACQDLQPSRRLLVYPGREHYPAPHDVEVVPLPVAAQLVRDRVGGGT